MDDTSNQDSADLDAAALLRKFDDTDFFCDVGVGFYMARKPAYICFAALQKILGPQHWLQILKHHRYPAVRCYAAWALAEAWESLSQEAKEETVFVACIDSSMAMGMSGCSLISESPLSILYQKLEPSFLSETIETVAARLLRTREWRTRHHLKLNHNIMSSILGSVHVELDMDAKVQNRLETCLPIPALLHDVPFVTLSQYAPNNHQKYEELILTEINALAAVESEISLSAKSATLLHFTIQELSYAIYDRPLPSFHSPVLAVVEKLQSNINVSASLLLLLIAPFALYDERAYKLFISRFVAVSNDMEPGFSSYVLDAVLQRYLRDRGLSGRCADTIVSNTMSLELIKTLPPEMIQKIDESKLFYSLIDFVIAQLNTRVFPGVDIVLYLLREHKSKLDRAQIVKFFTVADQLGSEILLPNLIVALEILRDDASYSGLIDEIIQQLARQKTVEPGLLSALLRCSTESQLPQLLEIALKYITQGPNADLVAAYRAAADSVAPLEALQRLLDQKRSYIDDSFELYHLVGRKFRDKLLESQQSNE